MSRIRKPARARALIAAGAAIICAVAAFSSSTAAGATSAAGTTPLLTYEGKDRTAKLVQCAKNEGGSLTIYTSTTAMSAFFVPAFQAAYPDIHASVLLDANTLASRLKTEEDGGQHNFDVYVDALGAMNRGPNYFQRIWTPNIGKLRAHLSSPYFVATNGFVEGMAYNSKITDPSTLPNTWKDLLDPKWAGKAFVAADPGSISYMGVLAKIYGKSFITSLGKVVRTQNASGRATADQVEAGIIPIGLSVSASYYQSDTVTKGLPLGWKPLQPVFVGWSGASIGKSSPHPCTAALFVDWFLSRKGGLAVDKTLGIPSPLNADPLLPFAIPNTTPMKKWTLAVITDPKVYKGYPGGLPGALQAWSNQFHAEFGG
jgi:iron(III) transport system substrate-binding protein